MADRDQELTDAQILGFWDENVQPLLGAGFIRDMPDGVAYLRGKYPSEVRANAEAMAEIRGWVAGRAEQREGATA